MRMQKIKIKGGYGEHGRSAFLVEIIHNHYCLIDCGILDTDVNPYPKFTQEEIEHTDYLFLTHSHKDHTGAVNKFILDGFNGTIIASDETIDFAGINYSKIYFIHSYLSQVLLEHFTFECGRAGHSPGSLWFYLTLETGDSYFFSGDYQENTLVTICDPVRNKTANVAFVDNAHDEVLEDALSIRKKLVKCIQEALEQQRKIVLPLQKYGRSVEILVLLNDNFPNVKIALSKEIRKAIIKSLDYPDWISKENASKLKEILDRCIEKDEDANIILLGDTHLEKEESQIFVKKIIEENGLVISTGRKKKGSFMASLLDEAKAISIPYPHHSSRVDAENLVKQNDFEVTLPFHNNLKEVWLKTHNS